jgi:hypothetical protein
VFIKVTQLKPLVRKWVDKTNLFLQNNDRPTPKKTVLTKVTEMKKGENVIKRKMVYEICTLIKFHKKTYIYTQVLVCVCVQ